MPKQTFFNLPEEKRQLILNLAIEEFAERDYKSASISNIVARAGIAKGSLYQYFDDKRDLYLYLVEVAGEEKKRFLACHPPPDPNMNVFDFLAWLIREGARFELSNPLLAQVASRALFSDRPFGDEPFAKLRKMALEYYRNLVDMGVAQGVIDPHIDRELAVFMFSSIFNEFGRFILEREGLDLQDLVKGEVAYQELQIEPMIIALMEIIRRGLAPRENGRSA
jgi:AcrR family transcriptional regulator